MVAGGHAWLLGGMHGCREGVCMVAGGHAWLQGACVVVGGACIGYDKKRSMRGQYASYWTAFLWNVHACLCIYVRVYGKCPLKKPSKYT